MSSRLTARIAKLEAKNLEDNASLSTLRRRITDQTELLTKLRQEQRDQQHAAERKVRMRAILQERRRRQRQEEGLVRAALELEARGVNIAPGVLAQVAADNRLSVTMPNLDAALPPATLVPRAVPPTRATSAPPTAAPSVPRVVPPAPATPIPVVLPALPYFTSTPPGDDEVFLPQLRATCREISLAELNDGVCYSCQEPIVTVENGAFTVCGHAVHRTCWRTNLSNTGECGVCKHVYMLERYSKFQESLYAAKVPLPIGDDMEDWGDEDQWE